MSNPRRSTLLSLVLAASLNAVPARADEAQDQYRVAAGHYSQQRWELACDEFQTFARDYPADPRAAEAEFYAAEALMQRERYGEARAQFQKLLQHAPAHRFARQATFRLGEAGYLAGGGAQAERDLQAFLDKYPGDERSRLAWAYLGELKLQDGHAAAAEKLFRKALELAAEGESADRARFGLAQALEKQGQTADADRSYQQLAADKSSQWADRARLGHLGLELAAGRYEEAAQGFADFRAAFPHSSLADHATLGHGKALFALGRYDEADQVFSSLEQHANLGVEARYWHGLTEKTQQHWSAAAKILIAAAAIDKQSSFNARLHFQAGDALFRDGNFGDAQKEFDRVLADWPSGDWADDCLLGKIEIACKQQDHTAAERLADEFLRRFPASQLRPDVLILLATQLVSLEKLDGAVETIGECLKSHPSDTKRALALATLVSCHVRSGRLDDATTAYEQLRQIDGQKATALAAAAELGDATYAAGKLKIAEKLFTTLANEQNPPRYVAKGLSGLAWIEFRGNNWSTAAETFQRLLTNYPDDALAAEAALVRGHALEKLEQPGEALSMYRLVIEKYPRSPEAPQALMQAGRLEALQHHSAQAISFYRRLADEHEDFAQLDEALYHEWRLLAETKNSNEAGTALERLRHEYPKSVYAQRAACRLADEQLGDKQYDQAQKLLDGVVAAGAPAETVERGLYLQGKLAVARERWNEVDKPLARLLKEFPDSPLAVSARYWTAEAEYRQGHFREAAAEFSQLAGETTGSKEKWMALVPLRQAQSLAQLDQWTQAFEIARKLETDCPDSDQQAELDYLIGRCLASQADFSGARERYRRAVRSEREGKTETAALAQWMIGESYFHQENYRAALGEYLRVEVLYDYPRWQAAALLQAGKCQERLGQWKAAAETYARLVKVYPQSDVAPDAAQRLELVQQKQQVVSKGK